MNFWELSTKQMELILRLIFPDLVEKTLLWSRSEEGQKVYVIRENHWQVVTVDDVKKLF